MNYIVKMCRNLRRVHPQNPTRTLMIIGLTLGGISWYLYSLETIAICHVAPIPPGGMQAMEDDAMLKIRRCTTGFALAVIAVLVIVPAAWAAEKAKPEAAAKGPMQAEATYDDPLGRSTPQGTVVGFLKAMQREDYERAVDFLDTRQTGKRAEQLALELSYILNEGMSTVTTALSIKPEGNLQDNLPENRELVGTVKTQRGEYKILLERVRKENNPPVWLFSSETLKLVPQIYEEIDIPWLERQLPAVLTETRVVGLPLYQWVLPVLMLASAFFLG